MTQLPAIPPAFPVPAERDEKSPYPRILQPEAQEEPILRRYWRILFQHRWPVLSIMAACLILAVVVSMLMQPQYTATTRIQVAREADKIVDMEGVGEERAGAASMEFYQTQYGLLKSRSLSEAVVQDLNLLNNGLFLADHDASEAEDIRSQPLTQRFELATTKVNENTTISPVRGSSIIDIEFNAHDARLAAAAANSIAENFIATNLSRRYEAAAYAREFLQKRLSQVRARLEESERKAVQYAQEQGLIRIRAGTAENPTEQSLIASNLAELSSQLTLARAQRAQAEAQYRAGTAGSVAAQSLTSLTVNELRRERSVLLGQLSKMESDYGPEYPAVIALRSQAAELDKQIGREQARVSSSVAQDLGGKFRQALAAEQSLQGRVEGLKSQLLGEQKRSIQFNILQRDVDTNRALYDALLQRFKEVGVAGGVGTNNVSIVDRALPPKEPSSPNLPLNLALGLVIGLILGTATALVLDQLAEAMILPDEFQKKLGIPLLGSTPSTRIGVRPKLLPAPAARVAVAESDLASTLTQGQSDLSEAYFSILTAVQFSTAKGAPHTIAVTSTQDREGKSTTALALARGLAIVGARVLLIDADMRSPSLHRSLDIKKAPGLSDLLTGRAELDEVLQDTDVKGLRVAVAGPKPPNPAELLAGEGLARTIEAAKRQFDHVIFDTPPVLGLADAPLIASAMEGTLFVVEAGRTRSSQARHALARLFGVRAHILGAVLTKLDSRSSGYGQGYGYNYRYGTR